MATCDCWSVCSCFTGLASGGVGCRLLPSSLKQWERRVQNNISKECHILHIFISFYCSPAQRIITLMHWLQATSAQWRHLLTCLKSPWPNWFSFICLRQITRNLCVFLQVLWHPVSISVPALLWQLCLRGGWSSDWDCSDSQHINTKDFFLLLLPARGLSVERKTFWPSFLAQVLLTLCEILFYRKRLG